jgi:catechol 2,3-dioxygenase-like lactoylglutathione lyase family enzyme
MSTTEDRSSDATLDMKLEVIVIPVADVDRAKEFYARLGWRLDTDVTRDDFRLVQFTPPGSGCSVQFGRNLTSAVPGSAQDLYLIGEVFHCSPAPAAGGGGPRRAREANRPGRPGLARLVCRLHGA